MKQVNIIVGRFQPITIGHLKCVEYALKETKCPTVLCMINTPDEKVDERHPFPSSMLLPMYRTLFADNKNISDIILVKNADIVKISEELRQRGYEIVSWACGTDRYDSYKQMAEKYAEKAHLPENFRVLEIKRTDEDASATRLRKALMQNDKTTFNNLFPTIPLKARLKTDFYTDLRNQLLKVIR